MGPMVSPLLEMILDSNYREGQPMGDWHNGGASWEQNANARKDSGNWGRTQQQRVNSLFEEVIALPRKLRGIPVRADDNT